MPPSKILVKSTAHAQTACQRLVDASAGFSMEPLPHDFFEFKVKPESARHFKDIGFYDSGAGELTKLLPHHLSWPQTAAA